MNRRFSYVRYPTATASVKSDAIFAVNPRCLPCPRMSSYLPYDANSLLRPTAHPTKHPGTYIIHHTSHIIVSNLSQSTPCPKPSPAQPLISISKNTCLNQPFRHVYIYIYHESGPNSPCLPELRLSEKICRILYIVRVLDSACLWDMFYAMGDVRKRCEGRILDVGFCVLCVGIVGGCICYLKGGGEC